MIDSAKEPWPAGYPAEETSRQSRGLEQFLAIVAEQEGAAVLDLGGANQANINYVTALGHRISSESILHNLDAIWGSNGMSDQQKVDVFLGQALDYPDFTFGGAMVWDGLQFLPAPILEALIAKLHGMLLPGAPLLAFFHSEDKARAVPSYTYRIVDPRTLLLTPRNLRTRVQFFSNRALEKIFVGFSSVKFFLTRDHLREVIVRR